MEHDLNNILILKPTGLSKKHYMRLGDWPRTHVTVLFSFGLPPFPLHPGTQFPGILTSHLDRHWMGEPVLSLGGLRIPSHCRAQNYILIILPQTIHNVQGTNLPILW